MGALGERWPDPVTVDRLGHVRADVTHEIADVLHRHIVCAQDGHEAVTEFARRPVLAEPRQRGDLLELPAHLPPVERRAVLTAEDEIVILPPLARLPWRQVPTPPATTTADTAAARSAP